MPNSRAAKAKPTDTEPAPLKPTAGASYHRGKRASSCPRCCHGNTRDPVAMETRGRAPKETTKARAAAAAAADAAGGEFNATGRRAKSRAAARGASNLQPSAHPETHYGNHSHKAFTVFAPNPKKRQDIQKQAEAELAALEDLRLSQAMGYVSISPSAVGGCLTLEEVRIKQQQEMQIKRRQKQMRKSALGSSPMVFG